ncbi:hypothetical protein [Agarilytica rhodophyticola]|uniref:hypothetical protein n=1 Tax=Agarilytica rhodophyticola TaxID=1737490 RepID=UPI000B343B4E|nr:hypothetical protein [Agarilytica rhodophyticola]
MLNDKDVYDALDRVAESRLRNTSVEDMVAVALAVWHEGFVPDVSWAKNLNPESQRVVGYMIEFLAGFNVLCHEERENLLSFSEKLKPSSVPYVTPDRYRDELATDWGLKHDVTPYFEHLSHFQTRHYGHNSDYERPSPNFVL